MGLSTKEVSGEWDQAPPQTEAAKLAKPLQQDQETEALKCPRCDSMNTKFCYYNNYNKSQPRYFCKACKRHWTKGGTLRNVPVGGIRKNKRAKMSNTATSIASDTTNVGPTNNFQCTNQNTELSDQKSMSSFLQALLQRTPSNGVKVEKEEKEFTWFSNALSSSNISNGENPFVGEQQEVIPKLEFPFSSVSGSFELNSSLMNSSSYQSLDVYENILDSVEESTITTVNIPTTSSTPWTRSGPSTIDLTNYWNWNEIDTLPENLWDEDGDDSSEIKP